MLGKVFGSFIAGILLMTVALQVSGVSAHGKKGPITSPVTSPITSPSTCKPGWGFGDKNHCHSDPRGLFDKDDDHHSATVSSHHEDNDDQGENHNNNHQNNGHH